MSTCLKNKFITCAALQVVKISLAFMKSKQNHLLQEALRYLAPNRAVVHGTVFHKRLWMDEFLLQMFNTLSKEIWSYTASAFKNSSKLMDGISNDTIEKSINNFHNWSENNSSHVMGEKRQMVLPCEWHVLRNISYQRQRKYRDWTSKGSSWNYLSESTKTITSARKT